MSTLGLARMLGNGEATVVRYAGRTTNGIPRQAAKGAAHPVLRIDGAVSQPLLLTPADLAELPRFSYLDARVEGELGAMPETNWSGVRLSDLIALAKPTLDARFVRASAGPYAVPVAIADWTRALLCDAIDGEALAVDRGGPWRLVPPGVRYFKSVKWIDRLEVTIGEPDDSAARIAVARARARAVAAAKLEGESD